MGASVKPSGTGHIPEGQGQQLAKAPEAKATPPPETDARAQLRRELGQVVRLSAVCLSVFVDRKAEAKTVAIIGEKAEGATDIC